MMKKKFLALIGIALALILVPAGMTVALAAPKAQPSAVVELNYDNGAFSATNGFTVATSGTITPSATLENGYNFAKKGYVSVTAPSGKAYLTADGGVSFAFRLSTTSNTQGAENGGIEKNEQLIHVKTAGGRSAYICMGGLYYQKSSGASLTAATKDSPTGYKAITTGAKDIVITIPGDASGVYWYANGVELYSMTSATGTGTAAVLLEAMREHGSVLYLHKGASSKSDFMTDCIQMSDFAVYGNALSAAEIANLYIERTAKTEKARNLQEKFAITYEDGVFTTSTNNITVTVDGDGIITDPDNSKAFKFSDTTSNVKISAANNTVLSQNGAMTIAFKQRVSSVDGAGYLETLVSAVNEAGESANLCLGELEGYRYVDDSGELSRSTMVRSAHQQILKSETEQFVMITFAAGAFHVYVNGVQAQQYFQAYYTEDNDPDKIELMKFIAETFVGQLKVENGTIILRNSRSSNSSWNKNVLCLSDVVFFDRELGAHEAAAYYAQRVADVSIEALEDTQYATYAYGTGAVASKEPVAPNAFAFKDTTSYVEIAAKDGYAFTKTAGGVSFHLKMKNIEVGNVNEALFAVESASEGAYINAGSLSYYDGSAVQTVAATVGDYALLTESWKIVSIVVNKATSSIEVYRDGEKVQTYTSTGANSVVAKVVALMSAEAEKQGGAFYVRKSADTASNTPALVMTNVLIGEGGLSEADVAGYLDKLVGVVEIPVHSNVLTSVTNIVGEVGAPIVAPKDTPAGYEFVGYYVDAQYLTPLAEGATFTSSIDALYAKYTLMTYSITYELNGGTQSSKNVTSYTIENEVTFYEPTREGYTFEGWYRTPEFRNKVVMIIPGTTGNFELYAKWSLTVYTISYDLGGGLLTEDNAVTTYTAESTVPLIDVWKPYYDFAGWYADADFTTKVDVFDVTQGADVTLYAKLVPTSYSITWITNGGTFNTTPVDTYTVEDNVILVGLRKNGYTFAGWYLDEDFTTKVDSLSVLCIDVTLYAKYTLATYTIVWNANGGTIEGTPATSYTVETPSVELPTATKDGYVFEGWYSDPMCNNKVDSFDVTTGANITLYANFTKQGGSSGCGGAVDGAVAPIAVLAFTVAAVAVVILAKKERRAK